MKGGGDKRRRNSRPIPWLRVSPEQPPELLPWTRSREEDGWPKSSGVHLVLTASIKKQGEITRNDDEIGESGVASLSGVGGGLGSGQCGRTEVRSQPALHHDHGGHL